MKEDKKTTPLVKAWQAGRLNPKIKALRDYIQKNGPGNSVFACEKHKDLFGAIFSAENDRELELLIPLFEKKEVLECKECRLLAALVSDDPAWLLI
ncbi:MAG: hypothetical protein HY435_01140 [Candidatus Liptonbacteria bacterium]|nr:hypothetical protein [Candidatus Liptonbacteria bacterium]